MDSLGTSLIKYKGKQALIQAKQLMKKNKLIHDLQMDDALRSTVFHKFSQQFQIQVFSEQPLNDGCVSAMSKNLIQCQIGPSLDLCLNKRWHNDMSEISDSAMQHLSEGLQFANLKELNLDLKGWGYWNSAITDTSFMHLGRALEFHHLQEFRLDLDMWAYENEAITDQGANNLFKSIEQMSVLGRLELNMKGWGDCNQNITDKTVQNITKTISKLDQLTELRLILWENISKPVVKNLNKTLAGMKNLNKIDLEFQSCQTVIRYPNHNQNEKLMQIKLNAQNRRRLLFQTQAVVINLLIPQYKQWAILLKL